MPCFLPCGLLYVLMRIALMYAIDAATHGAALHSTALHGAAWQGAASHIVASHSTASHVVARHNIEPRGTAQHCTAWAQLFQTRIGRERIQRPTHLDISELNSLVLVLFHNDQRGRYGISALGGLWPRWALRLYFGRFRLQRKKHSEETSVLQDKKDTGLRPSLL